jgi:hypothetical protein
LFSYFFFRQVVLTPIHNSRPTNFNAALDWNPKTKQGWLLFKNKTRLAANQSTESRQV